jgi:hypothetical protein
MSDSGTEATQGIDPDLVPEGGPDPEPGAPGGSDSTVGMSAEGEVSDPDADDSDDSSSELRGG